MVGVVFPPRLSYCRKRPVNTGRRPNERTCSISLSIYASQSLYLFNMWLIMCVSAGKKTDERISCSNTADETKKRLPKGFIKASLHTRSNKKQAQMT